MARVNIPKGHHVCLLYFAHLCKHLSLTHSAKIKELENAPRYSPLREFAPMTCSLQLVQKVNEFIMVTKRV